MDFKWWGTFVPYPLSCLYQFGHGDVDPPEYGLKMPLNPADVQYISVTAENSTRFFD